MDMDKIRLEIIGLEYTSEQAYALYLAEVGGKRKLPVIIGWIEAQSIAFALDKRRKFARPLTHDLMKNFARTYGIVITEVVIDKFLNGVFHAKLVCLHEGKITEIDSRTSDAVALAIRFKCAIYTYESIMSAAGIMMDMEEPEDQMLRMYEEEDLSVLTIQQLEEQIKEAVLNEDYELASKLRDEIKRRSEKS